MALLLRMFVHAIRLQCEEVCFLSDSNSFYLEYQLTDGESLILGFDDENDRDGCHISLDMYKGQLGPVDEAVLQRILGKFNGEVVSRRSLQ